MLALRILLACAVLFCGACNTLGTGHDVGEFVKRDITVGGVTHRYQVFVPSREAGGGKPPVILFLHGTGERGSDGDKPVQVGLGPHVRAHSASASTSSITER